jgi:RNA polymerase sigma-70 factor (ECF subfamily)
MSVVKDEYLAQEVLQTAFIRAYSGLKSFKGKSKFSTWFYRILINEAFKAVKKQSTNTDLDTVCCKIPEDDYFGANDKEGNQKYYLNEALKKIHSNESLALRLFYFEECSIEEITEITGWSNSNVKVILHRGRNNLRQVLEKIYKNDKAALYQ